VNYTFAPVSARSAARRRPVLLLACAGALVLGLSACGKTNVPVSTENDGVYVNAGPITYQLQVSRELNQYATEDKQYLMGLSPSQLSVTPTQEWYMVSLWAKNQTSRPEETNDNFDIVDTQGNHYYPVSVSSSLNPYVWTAQSLQPDGTEPAPDTTASFGPTQGSLLLFKLNTTVYDNRPLTLQIRGPSGTVWGTISLDL
jgi:hypothetical protein